MTSNETVPGTVPNRKSVVAVHLAARSTDVEKNLLHVEDLVREAVRNHSPSLIVLPERVAASKFDGRIHGRTTARPVDGAPLQLLRSLSRELDVAVAAGFHAHRGRDAFITYAFAEPDGRLVLHNKSFASPGDAAIARTGKKTRIVTRSDRIGATVGLVAGWEWLRTDTVRRLRGAADIALGGLCWNSLQPLGRRNGDPESNARQCELLEKLPVKMARSIGAPTVMASLLDANRVHSIPETPAYLGLIAVTQIVDADGTVLGRLGPDDAEGYIAADITLGRTRPASSVPSSEWLARPDDGLKISAALARTTGTLSYRVKRVLRDHAWHEWPAADLPDLLPPAEVGRQIVATSGPTYLRPSP